MDDDVDAIDNAATAECAVAFATCRKDCNVFRLRRRRSFSTLVRDHNLFKFSSIFNIGKGKHFYGLLRRKKEIIKRSSCTFLVFNLNKLPVC